MFRVRGSCLIVVSLSVLGVGCGGDGESEKPVNQPPEVPEPQEVKTDEDVPVAIRLLDGADDPEGDTLVVTQAVAADHRTEIASGGIVTLTPKQDFNGTIRMSFTVSDGAHSVVRNVSVVVRPINDRPVATSGGTGVRRSTPIVLAGQDVDGDALTYEIVTAPAHGTLSGVAPNLSYTPALDFTGDDSLTYLVRDAETSSEPATVRLQVVADAAPVARADTVILDEDAPTPITLRGSDSDGDPLTFTIATPPAHGTLAGTPPNVTYTPEPNFSGSDSLEFTVSDGFLGSGVAAIAIEVRAVNDAPDATPQTVAATEDTSSTITLAGTDREGDALTFQIQSFPSRGTLSGSGATWTYKPQADFNGADSFTFVASDGSRSSAPATVSIAVAAVNDPPVARALSRSFDEDTTAGVTLSSTDIDGGPSLVSYAIATPPAHGTLTGVAPFLTYRPAANYNGPDSFTYTAFDGAATSAPATVTLTVFPVHDSPVAISSSVTTSEDTPVAVTLQASNPDGGAIFFFLDSFPSDGELSGSDAQRTYTPAPNASGTRTFAFRVFANGETSHPATVTITINPVNDAPTTVDDYLEADPGEPLRFSVTSNDSDIEGDSFHVTSIGEPAHGTLVADGEGYLYTPDDGFTDIDVFAYEITDSHGAASAGSVHIGVGRFPPGGPTEPIATAGPRVDFDVETSISKDGRYVTFNSGLPLVADDTNGVHDIYLYDRGRRTLTRISAAIGGGDANGPSFGAQITPDARYVAFTSIASNLTAGDTNGRADVFRLDRTTGDIVRISVATGGAQGSGDSLLPRISDDGNLVAFRSSSFELVANDTNGVEDIFLRDVAAGATTRISVSINGRDADLRSLVPAISGDGRYVAFESSATNLVPDDTNNQTDTFVRDRVLGTTTRVSVSTNGGEANARCGLPSISQDGRFISFLSDATNLVPGAPSGTIQLYVRDTQSVTTTQPLLSSFDVNTARLSADGRYVAIGADDAVRIHDRFATVTLNPVGATRWTAPAISSNGRYVAVYDVVSGTVVVTPNTL